MHRNSKVSADFLNECVKTQGFSSQGSLVDRAKRYVLDKVEMTFLWTIETPNELIVVIFLKIVTCNTIKFISFNWRMEASFYFPQYPTEENSVQRFHVFSVTVNGWQLATEHMLSSFQGQLTPFQFSMSMESLTVQLLYSSWNDDIDKSLL